VGTLDVRGRRDPLSRSLQLLQRLGLTALPGESFAALCRRAARDHPDQADSFLAMADLQQRLVHAPITPGNRRHIRRQLARRA